MIEDGTVGSRAELARHLGVSRARVTQVLQLLTLSPSVIDATVQLGDPLSERIVSQRSLRSLAGMERDQQAQWLTRVLGSPIRVESPI